MRRFSALVLAAAFIVGLAGCAENGNSTPPSSPQQTTGSTSTTTTTETVEEVTTTTESSREDTTTTATTTESKTQPSKTTTTTKPAVYTILTDKTVKTAHILSTKLKLGYDLNHFSIVRTLSKDEATKLNDLLHTSQVELREANNWVKFIPNRPNNYAVAVEFTDDTCMIIAIHFSENSVNWIATATTNEAFDEEGDYKDLPYQRGIAWGELGDTLLAFVLNSNS